MATNGSKMVVAWTLAGAVVLGGCVAAQGDSDDQTPADDGSAAIQTQPLAKVVNVGVAVVAASSFTDFIRITGEVEAFSDVTISAEETGVVTRFLAEKGERVRGGQVIASLDNSVLTAQVSEARAAASLAQEQYERQRRLWEEEQIGSEIAFLQTKYQADIQQARLNTLEARLAKTTIRAPLAGVFDERFLEVGEMAVAGSRVARFVALDRVKVTGGVPERFAPSVAREDRALITFDILPGREFEGAIGYVGSSVNDQSRTFPIEIVIDNPDGVVKPKMVANVQLERLSLADVVVVPQEVVVRTEDGYQVFVAVERDGTMFASARVVELGPSYGDRVVLEGGLEFGERLIVAGALLVDDGSRVRIVDGSGE